MPDDLTLDEVAKTLGVHYMTVYKYVRTGRFSARQVGGRWLVSAVDLEAWRAAQRDDADGAVPGARPAPGRRRWSEELAATLVGGSESAAWGICTSALASSHTPESLYLEVLAPAMTRVGDGWADGRLTVAQEHRASAIVVRLIGRLGPLFIQRGRPKGQVILGAPFGDPHALASALLADLLRGRGLVVIDLGAHTPVESFLEALAGTGGRASIGVAISSPVPEGDVLGLMAQVRAGARGTVVLGGLQVAGLSPQARAELGLIGVGLSLGYRQALELLAPNAAAQPQHASA